MLTKLQLLLTPSGVPVPLLISAIETPKFGATDRSVQTEEAPSPCLWLRRPHTSQWTWQISQRVSRDHTVMLSLFIVSWVLQVYVIVAAVLFNFPILYCIFKIIGKKEEQGEHCQVFNGEIIDAIIAPLSINSPNSPVIFSFLYVNIYL